ncbi:hypothetical protein GCM10009853_071720 [Glycomyces scopariae]|uniref:Uncharacterized protein n=1 Tax=Glycomyces sambucus TaxID=380244 RepID=A0A1G9KE27_9ACTN|nr:hypothetical protein [Glycomyces sambucus]SDL47859.1 hypothetical protein SAMN05216298_4003 [Glycomyces sambucus]
MIAVVEEPAAGYGLLIIAQAVFLLFLVVAAVYALLAVMAALGLTSFGVLERFRRKREEPEDDGIDGLF